MVSKSVEQLYEEAWQLKPSLKKSQFMYEVFEQALAEGDTILAMQARLEEVDSRTFSEDDEKALVAFAWCLAEYNKDREKYDPEALTIVWSAKWIVDTIASNISIPRDKVLEQLEQFKKLTAEHGYNNRSYYETSCKVYRILGEPEKALQLGNTAKELPRDDMCDCISCFESRIVGIFLDLERYEEVFKMAQPLLAENSDICFGPKTTVLKMVAIYFLHKGNIEKAASSLKEAFAVSNTESDAYNIDLHALDIVIKIAQKKLEKALQVFSTYLSTAYIQPSVHDRLLFLKAAQQLMNALDTAGLGQSIVLKEGKGIEWFEEGKKYTATKLGTIFRTEIDELVAKIDARNGNTWQQDHKQKLYGLPFLV